MSHSALRIVPIPLLLSLALLGGYGIRGEAPRTVGNHLAKEGLKPLNLTLMENDDVNSSDYLEWKKIIESPSSSGMTWQTFASWTGTEYDSSDKAKINRLKLQCEYKLKVQKEEKTFDFDLKNVKEYCTKKEI